MPTLKQPKPGADELPPPSARGRGRGRGGGGGGEGRANGQGGRGGAGKASAGAGKPQQQQQSSTKAGGAPPQKPSTNGQLADKPAANGPTNGSAGDSEGDAKKKRYVDHVCDQRPKDAVLSMPETTPEPRPLSSLRHSIFFVAALGTRSPRTRLTPLLVVTSPRQ